MSSDEKIELLKNHVKEYPDFPKKGVLFRDLFSIFENPDVTEVLKEVLLDYARAVQPPVDVVAALDARGFLLGPWIALELHVPFVPIRKKGKLPGKTLSEGYQKEYGEDWIEMQSDSVKKGQRVLVVDDLLATGGSLGAACNLIRRLGGEPVCLVLMELRGLNGRAKIPVDVTSILEY